MTYWCAQCKAVQPLVVDETRRAQGESEVVHGWCAVCGAPMSSIGVYRAEDAPDARSPLPGGEGEE